MPSTVATVWLAIRNVASTSAGRVTMSPVAVMIGDPIASMSQLRDCAVRARKMTPTRMKALDSTPPTTDTTMSCHTLMLGSPNTAATARAAIAASADEDRLSSAEDARFW